MANKIIFVAFAIEDERQRDFLKGQALLGASPFEYTDMSVKEAYDSDWKEKVRTRNLGRRSTYRRGKSVQTTGTTSMVFIWSRYEFGLDKIHTPVAVSLQQAVNSLGVQRTTLKIVKVLIVIYADG